MIMSSNMCVHMFFRSFDVELSYVPIEETSAILEKRERCFSRYCIVCHMWNVLCLASVV